MRSLISLIFYIVLSSSVSNENFFCIFSYVFCWKPLIIGDLPQPKVAFLFFFLGWPDSIVIILFLIIYDGDVINIFKSFLRGYIGLIACICRVTWLLTLVHLVQQGLGHILTITVSGPLASSSKPHPGIPSGPVWDRRGSVVPSWTPCICPLISRSPFNLESRPPPMFINQFTSVSAWCCVKWSNVTKALFIEFISLGLPFLEVKWTKKSTNVCPLQPCKPT